MIFDDAMAAHTRALRAFLSDPDTNLMFLRVDPDIELIAARFIALYNARSATAEEIAFAVSGAFSTPEAFYREAAASVAEAAEPFAKQLRALGEDVVVPAGVAWSRPRPAASAEVLFAEYLEGVARAFAGYHATTIYALRFDALPDPAAAVTSLARLSAALCAPGVKLVVFDERVRPRFDTVRATRGRYARQAFSALVNDPVKLLRNLAASDALRVLALETTAGSVTRLLDALAAPTVTAAGVRGFVVQAPFRHRAQYATEVLRAVRRELFPPGTAAPHAYDDVYDLRSFDGPELALTELLERLLDAALGPDQIALVTLIPSALYNRELWTAFVAALGRAAVSARVRYVPLDIERFAPLPAPPGPIESSRMDFALPVEAAEQSAAKAFADPALPPPLKIQYALMLAGFAVARREWDRALTFGSDAIKLAERHGSVEQQSIAWWSLGHALARMEKFDIARNAYAQAADLALDRGNAPAAANALMGVGHTLFRERAFGEALRAYDAARLQWEVCGQLLGAAQALAWTGETLAEAGDVARAEATFRDVQSRYRALGEPFRDAAQQGEAETLERLAALYARARRNDEARACRDQARALGSHGVLSRQPA